MPSSFNLIWWVLGLPIFGFLIQSLLGKRVIDTLGPKAGRRVMGALAVAPIAIAFFLAVAITRDLASLPAEVRAAQGGVLTLFDWIDLASIRVPFEVRVDTLSMTMVLIITGIGALIHLYATGYMAEEPDYPRFFTYLNLFIAAMLILVLGNNLVMLFIGWEGVGLCSYLLIGFWYKDVANAKAANKAFIVNRIGDWGLTLGMFLLMVLIIANRDLLGADADRRWLSYDVMMPHLVQILGQNPGWTTAVALLLFVGACGKSAQFPLYLWLPDAMAGPTPVSALIHAATMVTSGVVLLNRMNVVFQMSPVASAIICVIGAFTALFAALIAFGQTDIKKVLAYSTVSQLGFMFIGAGAGGYWTGMFHVTTHAFFKALLFLGSGAVIHAMAHNQDMRNYGNLRKYLPITSITMIIGWIAIAGLSIPISGESALGFAGFYSKEVILGTALANSHGNIAGVNFSVVAGWIGLFVAALTAMYMTRMTLLTFFGSEERWRAIPAHAHGHGHHAVEEHAVAQEHNPVTMTADEQTLAHMRADADAEAAATGHHGVQVEVTSARHDAGGSPVAPVHSVADVAHDAHAHHGHHDHGPDVHGFFYTDEELHAREHGDHHDDHHHELDGSHKPHEVPVSMWFPLVVLAVLSVAGGFFLYNNHFFQYWLYPGGELSVLGKVDYHPHGLPLLWLSIVAAFGGTIAGVLIYRKGLPKKEGWDEKRWSPFRRLARDQFGYDAAMVSASVDGGADLARFTWKGVDATLVDGLVNGAGWVASQFGRGLKFLQTGYIRFYAMLMLVGVVGFLGWFVYAITLGGVK